MALPPYHLEISRLSTGLFYGEDCPRQRSVCYLRDRTVCDDLPW